MQFLKTVLIAGLFSLATGCLQESGSVSSEAKRDAPKAQEVPQKTAPEPPAGKYGIEPTVKSITSTGPGEFEITYEWRVAKKLDHNWRVFVHFTDLEGQIRFQNDHDPEPGTTQWETGKIQQGPFKVKIPDGLEGEFQIRMGLYDQEKPGEGSRGRRELDGKDDGERRIVVGRLRVGDATIELLPIN